jgi:hypothetical protein
MRDGLVTVVIQACDSPAELRRRYLDPIEGALKDSGVGTLLEVHEGHHSTTHFLTGAVSREDWIDIRLAGTTPFELDRSMGKLIDALHQLGINAHVFFTDDQSRLGFALVRPTP